MCHTLRLSAMSPVRLENEKAGQNGRKSVKSWIFPTIRGATGTVVHRLDATRILPEHDNPGYLCAGRAPQPYTAWTKSQQEKTHTFLQYGTVN